MGLSCPPIVKKKKAHYPVPSTELFYDLHAIEHYLKCLYLLIILFHFFRMKAKKLLVTPLPELNKYSINIY